MNTILGGMQIASSKQTLIMKNILIAAAVAGIAGAIAIYLVSLDIVDSNETTPGITPTNGGRSMFHSMS